MRLLSVPFLLATLSAALARANVDYEGFADDIIALFEPPRCGPIGADVELFASVGLVHFDDFSPCGRTVRITDPKSKQSVNATVVDECALCLGDGDIALSRAALAAFDVEQSLLPIFVNWSFV